MSNNKIQMSIQAQIIKLQNTNRGLQTKHKNDLAFVI